MISKEEINRIITCLVGIDIAFIDLFSGAGGTTTGIEHSKFKGKKIAKVVLCVNHDAVAIESHLANHPDAIHLVEDVRKVKMDTLIPLIKEIRRVYPKIKICLWASLECTNFSKAKGGQPRNADSRTLAWDLLRYIITIKPERIYIENVEEFMSWGPLNSLGKPESKLAGTDYLDWIESIKKCGYQYEFKIINSADLGAYTARKRYFGQFVQDGEIIKWPVLTHEKVTKKSSGLLTDWKAVRDVLNLDTHGQGILIRKKPLSEKTLERILIGANKFVKPLDTDFFIKYHSTGKNVLDLNGPASTIATKDSLALVQTQFMDQQYGASTPVSLENPAATITANPKLNIISCTHFIDKQFSTGNCNNQSVSVPSGTITSVPKLNLVTCQSFLINPQWFNKSAISIDVPCPTIIARMDKTPLYVATTEQVNIVKVFVIESMKPIVNSVIQTRAGNLIYILSTYDSPMTRNIKLFMAQNGIIDIKMRMLDIDELLRIQGFPDGYILKGTKTNQKKFIGNSVVPLVSEKLIEACFN